MKRLVSTLALVLVPAIAEACASCISSPFGDRTYNWPYLVLILVPFAVAAVVAGVMLRVTGVSISELRRQFMQLFDSEAGQEETT